MTALDLTSAKSYVLWQLRHDKGWTLREATSKGVVALGYLSEIERGKKQPSDELLAELLRIFEVSPAEYLRKVADLVE